jgi:preprotein translocase subunit SecD
MEMRLSIETATPDTEDMILTNAVTKATEVLHVQKTAIVDQATILSSCVQRVSGMRHPFVEIALTETGRDRLAEVTRENVGRHLVIVVDAKLLSAPKIKAEIKDGRAWIAGDFSEKGAAELVARINSAIKK